MALQKTGVQIVTDGADKAIASLDRYRKALERATKAQASAEKSAAGLRKLTSGLDKVAAKAKRLDVLDGVNGRMKSLLNGLSGLVPGMDRLSTGFNRAGGSAGNLLMALKGIPPPALAAAAAVAALAVGLGVVIALGARGARLEQTAAAFGNMVADAGSATEVLNGLRKATRGTIADFELMRLTTLALAGQQAPFRKELLAVGADGTTAAGRIIDATRRIAQATGQNEAIIREKFLTGLRLQSKLRLDDVGVMVDAQKANELYAESIGKSAAALTEQEQKAAFAREGIRQLDEIMLSFGDRSTVLERFARPAVALRNVLDKLALSAVPAFTPIAKLFGQIGDAIESFASLLFPVIVRISQFIGNLLSLVGTLAKMAVMFSPMAVVFAVLRPIIIYTIAAITLLLDALNALFQPLTSLLNVAQETGGSVGIMRQAFQKLLEPMAAVVNFLSPVLNPALNALKNTLLTLAVIVAIPFFLLKAAIEALAPVVTAAAAGIRAFAMTVINTVRAAASAVITTLSGLTQPIVGVFTVILSTASAFFQQVTAILNTAFSNMVFMAGFGGGAITGAFATGLLRGGTQVITAVTAIAQIVADFLQGESPPKVGPLSRIDQGGFNVAKSWAEGFQQGFVRPMAVVRDEITSVLGEIGNLVASDLEGRFKALDIALLPFNEQLDLAKARVEEIAGFVDPALKAVERQRKAALQAFAQGDAGAEEVRQYDRQLDRLRGIKEQTEAISDQAEIEFAFAKSQQAVQRTLLEIQKRRLELFGKEEVAAEAIAKATESAGGGGGAGAAKKDTVPKEEKAKKGTGEAAVEDALGGGLTSGDAPDLLANAAIDNARDGILGFFSGIGDIAGGVAGKVGEAGGQFGEGFATGFADSGFDAALGEFNAGTGELQAQIARIAESNPVQAITDKFSGLATALTDPLAGMTDAIGSVFGPEGDIFQAVNGLFSGEGLFGPDGLIATAIPSLFGADSPLMLALLPEGPLLTQFTAFKEMAISSISGMRDGILTQFNMLLNGITQKMATLSTIITLAFSSPASPFQIARNVVSAVFQGIQNVIATFASTGVGGALSGLASKLFTDLQTPVITTLNNIIAAFEGVVNSAINALPEGVKSALRAFGLDLSPISVDRLSGGTIPIPAGTYQPTAVIGPRDFGPAAPGRARGGLGVRGLAVIGENGPELVNLRRPADIFPANITRNILDFMANPVSPMGPGQIQNNTTNNNNNQRTVNANFNNTSPRESLLILRELEAL